MSQPYKICPICESPNHRNATICSTCGATLTQVPLITPDDSASNQGSGTSYDQHYGETDLFESNLHWKGGTYLVGGIITLAILACTATLLVLGTRLLNNTGVPAIPGFGTATAIPTLGGSGLEIATNTPRPTIFLATVTQGPPTETPTPSPTITPTQGPCTQVVLPGDDLISIIYRCGHRNFESIVDTVVALNKLQDAGHIQEGQTIEVPWPTPTLDPNALPTESPTGAQAGDLTSGVSVADANADGASIMGVRLVPTETLQPGVTWHTVVKDENIIIIAVEYGATLRILSELNPEITFSQCDFGLGTGGANCNVQLFEGQQVRVPAPTPTPTIQPSPNGSETPTPTATATFNAPTALSPSNRAFFGKDDLVTLRWVASGSLGPGQAYLIHVEDQTGGKSYQATSQDLFFIIPQDWHGQENDRHDYTWTVSMIDTANPDHPYFTTEMRLFTWQGQGSK